MESGENFFTKSKVTDPASENLDSSKECAFLATAADIANLELFTRSGKSSSDHTVRLNGSSSNFRTHVDVIGVSQLICPSDSFKVGEQCIKSVQDHLDNKAQDSPRFDLEFLERDVQHVLSTVLNLVDVECRRDTCRIQDAGEQLNSTHITRLPPSTVQLNASLIETNGSDILQKINSIPCPSASNVEENANEKKVELLVEETIPTNSYTLNFYSCPECSIVFENEKRLLDHEEKLHPLEIDPFSRILSTTNETKKTNIEDLYKLAKQTCVRVTLENIGKRSKTCELCGTSVLAVEFSSHRRSHNNDNEETGDSDCSGASEPEPSRRTTKRNPSLKSPCSHKKLKRSSKSCPSKSSVRLKMKIEAKAKPHCCRFCDKRFVSASQCKSHENAHSEITEEPESPTASRKRGRRRKADEIQLSNDLVNDACTNCSLKHSERTCKSVQNNGNNQKEVSILDAGQPSANRVAFQLEGMPILKPKVERIDWSFDTTNQDYGPPELKPVKEESIEEKSSEISPESESHLFDTCQTCGEEIKRSELLEHIRGHLVKGQRDCSLCEYCGNNPKDLKEHINKHYDLRPYECRYCDKDFCWETGLKRHLQVWHVDMQPFKCTQCSFRFETHRERRRHELTHKSIRKPDEKITQKRPTRRLSNNVAQSPERLSLNLPRRMSLGNSAAHSKESNSSSYVPPWKEIKTSLSQPAPENFQSATSRTEENQGSHPNSLLDVLVNPQSCPRSNQTVIGDTQLDFRDLKNELPTALSSTPQQYVSASCGQDVKIEQQCEQSKNLSMRKDEDSFTFTSYEPTNATNLDDSQGKLDKTDSSTEIYHEKPDTREFEKCKTCGLEIPINDLMKHIQSHLKPLQKKCDICSYEATSSKLLPEHMNIHYVLKPFQCKLCNRRFAMKGYLRSHHQQVHESADNRRYQCNFCDKRFVRPCHRKAHEKGVHLREGGQLPSTDVRKTSAIVKNQSKSKPQGEVKENSQGSESSSSSAPNDFIPPLIPMNSNPNPAYPVQQIQQSHEYNNSWPNSIEQQQGLHYTGQIPNHHPPQPVVNQSQGQDQYWMQQTQNQQGLHHSPSSVQQIPAQNHNVHQPNNTWSDFQPSSNHYDLKAADHMSQTGHYANANPHYSGQGQQLQPQIQPQMQNYANQNYSNDPNAFNYQSFNAPAIPAHNEYSYSSPNQPSWPDGDNRSAGLTPNTPLTMNYGTYNNSSVGFNGAGDNNVSHPDFQWSAAPTNDPYATINPHTQQSPVLHEGSYTISRPTEAVVDLWAECQNEEMKFYAQNGYGSYSQQGMAQNSGDGVPLITAPSLPLIPDFDSADPFFSNGCFEPIANSSPDHSVYDRSISGPLFNETPPDITPDDSSSAHSASDFERPNSEIACRTCGQYFSKTDIIPHVRSHLGKGQKVCDVCGHVFCSSVALRDHVGTHYAPKPFQCLICFKYFSTKHSLKNHVSCIHEGKKEARCHICNKTFTLVFSLRRHMKLVHKLNPKNGLTLAPLLAAEQTRGQSNKNKKKQQQKQPEAGSARVSNARNSQEGSEEEKERRNELHRRILERSWIVNLIDVGRNKIDCGVCKTSVLVKDLIFHRQNHKDPCHICGKLVRIEEMLHHGVTHVISLVCEICSWKGKTRSQIYEHMNTHLGMKPIKCTVCGASFASRTSLRTHYLQRHTNFRPHHCSFCERTFVQLSVRRTHEITHYGTKCPICEKNFERKKDLGIHMKEWHWHTEDETDNVRQRLPSNWMSEYNS